MTGKKKMVVAQGSATKAVMMNQRAHFKWRLREMKLLQEKQQAIHSAVYIQGAWRRSEAYSRCVAQKNAAAFYIQRKFHQLQKRRAAQQELKYRRLQQRQRDAATYIQKMYRGYMARTAMRRMEEEMAKQAHIAACATLTQTKWRQFSARLRVNKLKIKKLEPVEGTDTIYGQTGWYVSTVYGSASIYHYALSEWVKSENPIVRINSVQDADEWRPNGLAHKMVWNRSACTTLDMDTFRATMKELEDEEGGVMAYGATVAGEQGYYVRKEASLEVGG